MASTPDAFFRITVPTGSFYAALFNSVNDLQHAARYAGYELRSRALKQVHVGLQEGPVICIESVDGDQICVVEYGTTRELVLLWDVPYNVSYRVGLDCKPVPPTNITLLQIDLTQERGPQPHIFPQLGTYSNLTLGIGSSTSSASAVAGATQSVNMDGVVADGDNAMSHAISSPVASGPNGTLTRDELPARSNSSSESRSVHEAASTPVLAPISSASNLPSGQFMSPAQRTPLQALSSGVVVMDSTPSSGSWCLNVSGSANSPAERGTMIPSPYFTQRDAGGRLVQIRSVPPLKSLATPSARPTSVRPNAPTTEASNDGGGMTAEAFNAVPFSVDVSTTGYQPLPVNPRFRLTLVRNAYSNKVSPFATRAEVMLGTDEGTVTLLPYEDSISVDKLRCLIMGDDLRKLKGPVPRGKDSQYELVPIDER